MSNVSGAASATNSVTTSTEPTEKPAADVTEMAKSFESLLDTQQNNIGNIDSSASMDTMLTVDGSTQETLPGPAQQLSEDQRATLAQHAADGKEIVQEKEDQAKNEADYKLAQAESQYRSQNPSDDPADDMIVEGEISPYF